MPLARLTGRALGPTWPPSRSTAAYAGLVGLLVGVRALFAVVPPAVPLASQSAVLSWPAVVALAVAGGVGLALARTTDIPGARPRSGSDAADGPDRGPRSVVRRHLEPALVGLVAAAALVALDRALPLGVPRVALPLSVPFYLYGAVASEVLLRLVPLGTAVWLASRLGADRRRQAAVFGALAAATALVEPVGLVGVVAPTGGPALALVLLVAYALNLAAAVLFWRYGFLAAVVERAAFYLAWHVVYGGLG